MKTLITNEDVIALAFSQNELRSPSIITKADITEAESRYIDPILGAELRKALDEGNYPELLNGYVAPAIAAWTRCLVQPLLANRCEACLSSDETSVYESTTAGNNRLGAVLCTLRRKASILSRRLSSHLNTHSETYAEYNPALNPLNRCSIDGDIVQIR